MEALYAPAPRSLARVLQFSQALAAVLDGEGGEATSAEPSLEATTMAAALSSKTRDEARDDALRRTAERAVRLHEALVAEGRAAEFAPIVVIRSDGLPVTEADVASDDFPAAVFAEAFGLFTTSSGELTRGALGLPSATGSPGADRPKTPTSPR